MKHWIKQSLVAGTAFIAMQAVAGAEERVLNWKTYENVRDYADRKESDMHYLSVPWKETVLDGLITGQKLDKPILLWLYFGDGRGHC